MDYFYYFSFRLPSFFLFLFSLCIICIMDLLHSGLFSIRMFFLTGLVCLFTQKLLNHNIKVITPELFVRHYNLAGTYAVSVLS